MSPDKLVHMANQIGKFFSTQPHEDGVAGVTGHIVKFWDPRMRAKILAHFAEGGAGLDPLAKEAIAKLAEMRDAREA